MRPRHAGRMAGSLKSVLANMTGSPVIARYVSEIASRCGLILALYSRPHSSECAVREHRAVVGANGAGKSTAMQAMSWLLRPADGSIILNDERIDSLSAYLIAARGLALVPEGRQMFSKLSVLDNILLGAYTRSDTDLRAEAKALLRRFPLLRDRIDTRAGSCPAVNSRWSRSRAG
jgi:ABC-type branched-subunit amino acid transport system ATPase component